MNAPACKSRGIFAICGLLIVFVVEKIVFSPEEQVGACAQADHPDTQQGEQDEPAGVFCFLRRFGLRVGGAALTDGQDGGVALGAAGGIGDDATEFPMMEDVPNIAISESTTILPS